MTTTIETPDEGKKKGRPKSPLTQYVRAFDQARTEFHRVSAKYAALKANLEKVEAEMGDASNRLDAARQRMHDIINASG